MSADNGYEFSGGGPPRDLLPSRIQSMSRQYGMGRTAAAPFLDRIIGPELARVVENYLPRALGIDLPQSMYGSRTYADMARAGRSRREANQAYRMGRELDERYYDQIGKRVNQTFGTEFDSGDISKFMQYGAPAVSQAFGIDLGAVTGGLPSDLAESMYHAGRGMRGGNQYMSMGDVREVTERISGRARDDKGSIDYGYTKGFTLGEMGEMAEGMVARGGMLYSTTSREGKADQIESTIKSTMETMQILKDVLGNPDASVQELFGTLDEVFGPQSNLKTALPRMKAVLRETEATAGVLGISPDQALNIVGGTAARWAATGGNAAVGERLGLNAMQTAVMAQRFAANNSREGDVTGMTLQDAQQFVPGAFGMARGTPQGKALLLVTQALKMGRGDASPEARKYAEAAENGTLGELLMNVTAGDIPRIAGMFGLSGNDARMLSDPDNPMAANIEKDAGYQSEMMGMGIRKSLQQAGQKAAGSWFKGDFRASDAFFQGLSTLENTEGALDEYLMRFVGEGKAFRNIEEARTISSGYVGAEFDRRLTSGKDPSAILGLANRNSPAYRTMREDVAREERAQDLTREFNPSVRARGFEQSMGRMLSSYLGGESDLKSILGAGAGTVTDEEISGLLDDPGMKADLDQAREDRGAIDEYRKIVREGGSLTKEQMDDLSLRSTRVKKIGDAYGGIFSPAVDEGKRVRRARESAGTQAERVGKLRPEQEDAVQGAGQRLDATLETLSGTGAQVEYGEKFAVEAGKLRREKESLDKQREAGKITPAQYRDAVAELYRKVDKLDAERTEVSKKMEDVGGEDVDSAAILKMSRDNEKGGAQPGRNASGGKVVDVKAGGGAGAPAEYGEKLAVKAGGEAAGGEAVEGAAAGGGKGASGGTAAPGGKEQVAGGEPVKSLFPGGKRSEPREPGERKSIFAGGKTTTSESGYGDGAVVWNEEREKAYRSQLAEAQKDPVGDTMASISDWIRSWDAETMSAGGISSGEPGAAGASDTISGKLPEMAEEPGLGIGGLGVTAGIGVTGGVAPDTVSLDAAASPLMDFKPAAPAAPEPAAPAAAEPAEAAEPPAIDPSLTGLSPQERAVMYNVVNNPEMGSYEEIYKASTGESLASRMSGLEKERAAKIEASNNFYTPPSAPEIKEEPPPAPAASEEVAEAPTIGASNKPGESGAGQTAEYHGDLVMDEGGNGQRSKKGTFTLKLEGSKGF